MKNGIEKNFCIFFFYLLSDVKPSKFTLHYLYKLYEIIKLSYNHSFLFVLFAFHALFHISFGLYVGITSMCEKGQRNNEIFNIRSFCTDNCWASHLISIPTTGRAINLFVLTPSLYYIKPASRIDRISVRVLHSRTSRSL